jgi:cell division protein FtsQ
MHMAADLLLLLGLAGLAWAAALAIQRLPFFPLREVVVVTTPTQVSAQQLEQAARAGLAGNFFTLDLDRARATFEKLPWVRRADLRRRWPDTLELRIEEHVAVARWRQADGEALLVNEQGEVFAAAPPAPLPLLAGPEGSAAQVLARQREFDRLLAPVQRQVAALQLSDRQAWQLRMDDGVVLELGRDDPRFGVGERLARFAPFHRPTLLGARIAAGGVVDLRYPNGFALRAARSS